MRSSSSSVDVALQVGADARRACTRVDGDAVAGPAPRAPRRRTARWRSWTGRRPPTGRSRGASKWMSSKTTGERRWALELSETIRAPPAAASASCRPVASAKWPRWLVANCSSQPSGVRCSSGERHHAGVVDQDVQRAVPGGDERGDRGLVGEVEAADADGPAVDRRGGALARGGVAHGEGHLGAGAGQRAGGLDADAGRAAGDDRALAGQVDALDDLGGRGVEAERGGDGCHATGGIDSDEWPAALRRTSDQVGGVDAVDRPERVRRRRGRQQGGEVVGQGLLVGRACRRAARGPRRRCGRGPRGCARRVMLGVRGPSRRSIGGGSNWLKVG